MKKTVFYAKIIFWLAFLIFMIAMMTKEVMSHRDRMQLMESVVAIQSQTDSTIQPVATVIKTRAELTWFIWVSGGIMFLAFTILEMSSSPKPIIKPGCVYTIEKVISHNYRNHTVVLNNNENIELFRCRFVSNLESLRTDQKYTVQQIDNDLSFTPA